jgi:hypothetical protein
MKDENLKCVLNNNLLLLSTNLDTASEHYKNL